MSFASWRGECSNSQFNLKAIWAISTFSNTVLSTFSISGRCECPPPPPPPKDQRSCPSLAPVRDRWNLSLAASAPRRVNQVKVPKWTTSSRSVEKAMRWPCASGWTTRKMTSIKGEMPFMAGGGWKGDYFLLRCKMDGFDTWNLNCCGKIGTGKAAVLRWAKTPSKW